MTPTITTQLLHASLIQSTYRLALLVSLSPLRRHVIPIATPLVLCRLIYNCNINITSISQDNSTSNTNRNVLALSSRRYIHIKSLYDDMYQKQWARMMSFKSNAKDGRDLSKSTLLHSINNTLMPQNNQTIKQEGNSIPNECSTYSEAIKDLNSLQSNSQVLALAKYKQPETILPLFTRQLTLAGLDCDRLDELNVIHVAGTKGKGSTCSFIESLLLNQKHHNRRGQLKVGCYTSPHLISVTERIRLDGVPISEQLFSKYFRQIYNRLVETIQVDKSISMPSYFSFLTILAFHIFLEERVDCAIIEVGIGGEYDPTNIVKRPIACCITTLDLDHTNILGNTIESIARAKAGIIKKNVPVFTVEHEHRKVIDVIEQRAREKVAPVLVCKPIEATVKLGIDGMAQRQNAALACQAAAYWLAKVNNHEPAEELTSPTGERSLFTNFANLPDNFRFALNHCQLAGRCQMVAYKPGITFFIDGAHTRKSMENCLEWFVDASERLDPNARKILMINVIGERDKREVLRPLTLYKHFNLVVFSTNCVHPIREKAADIELCSYSVVANEKSIENAKRNATIWLEMTSDSNSVLIEPSVQQSIRRIQNTACDKSNSCHILATGSLHFAGAVLEALKPVM